MVRNFKLTNETVCSTDAYVCPVTKYSIYIFFVMFASTAIFSVVVTIKEIIFPKKEGISQKAAEEGNVIAQYNLGLRYYLGDDVPQDYGKAVEWWQKAAQQDYADAQFNLGLMYQHGMGVPQIRKSGEMVSKSCRARLCEAQFLLGLMYQHGMGVPQDYKKRCNGIKKLPLRVMLMPNTVLGLAYENGNGIAQDDEKAVEWYQKSCRSGLC